MITGVGDEHMGRFILEQLAREGVETRGVMTDPERLTALVLLGIRDHEQFPLIFYRENCADMALCEDDIDEALLPICPRGGGHGNASQPPAHRGCRAEGAAHAREARR